MKISARNRFPGKVTTMSPGAVNSEVTLTSAAGVQIVAIVTNESVKRLGLKPGRDATALVKASHVLVSTESADVIFSARNCLSGTVTQVVNGPVSAEVTIALPGGAALHATITHDAAAELGLRAGVPATGVFKASAVIFAVAP